MAEYHLYCSYNVYNMNRLPMSIVNYPYIAGQNYRVYYPDQNVLIFPADKTFYSPIEFYFEFPTNIVQCIGILFNFLSVYYGDANPSTSGYDTNIFQINNPFYGYNDHNYNQGVTSGYKSVALALGCIYTGEFKFKKKHKIIYENAHINRQPDSGPFELNIRYQDSGEIIPAPTEVELNRNFRFCTGSNTNVQFPIKRIVKKIIFKV